MATTTQSTRIFVVEDNQVYRQMLKYFVSMNPDHEVHAFSTGKECLDNLRLGPTIITLDYTLPDMSGGEVLRRIKNINEEIGVIVISGQQDVSTAVELLRKGAFDYITKDNETKERLLNSIENLKSQLKLKHEVDQLRQELGQKYELKESLIGQSKAMQPVFQLIEKAAKTSITVSISGETGTGKERVARSIHFNSGRRKGPFVAVNMSAIPKDLMESELFGHEKGAFTGAMSRKKGQFELADGGTLFLDEIGETEPALQAKLLRALQEREITRVGGEKPVKFDARIITATHRDLADEVRRGNFREDLYYRLLGLTIQLPPLRDRDNDILLMAHAFLEEFVRDNKMGRLEFSREAKRKLLSHTYPGNVRELRSIVELSAVIADGPMVKEADIQFQSVRADANLFAKELTLEEYKNQIIHHYLEKYNNDVLLVARKLDIGKSTIYRLLKMEQAD